MTFTGSFYTNRKSAALASARRLPERMRVSSITDVGCGTTSWLAAFTELGVTDLHEFDGRSSILPRERVRSKASAVFWSVHAQGRFHLLLSRGLARRERRFRRLEERPPRIFANSSHPTMRGFSPI